MAFDKKTYNREYSRKWRMLNKERKKKSNEEYRKTHPHKIYKLTPKSRASKLLYAYNQADIKANRGLGDLTTKWIIDNIFTQPCTYCGKTGWDIVGCNRIDNSKPHTKDNVEPCCGKCNIRLKRK